MAIDILNDRSFSSVKGNQASASRNVIAKGADKAQVVATNNVTGDAVVLTDSAKAMSRATTIAMSSDGIDHAKVDSLKAAVRDGSYKINYDSIASKMIDDEAELSSIFG